MAGSLWLLSIFESRPGQDTGLRYVGPNVSELLTRPLTWEPHTCAIVVVAVARPIGCSTREWSNRYIWQACRTWCLYSFLHSCCNAQFWWFVAFQCGQHAKLSATTGECDISNQQVIASTYLIHCLVKRGATSRCVLMRQRLSFTLAVVN